MTFYTKKGDDGTTGLYFGGRLRKDSERVHAYGTVDEAQAFLGVARAECGEEAGSMLLEVERDLYVLMAELATAESNRGKLVAGTTLVTSEMVSRVGAMTDSIAARFEMPSQFVLPGQDRVSAALEVARTVVRRAERDCIAVLDSTPDSQVVPYLNRLSSLLWAMARWQEGEAVFAKSDKERP